MKNTNPDLVRLNVIVAIRKKVELKTLDYCHLKLRMTAFSHNWSQLPFKTRDNIYHEMNNHKFSKE